MAMPLTETTPVPDMIAVAAHELRTPLNVVTALAQLLERDVQRRLRRGAPGTSEWETEHTRLLDKLHELCRAAERLKMLSEDLLNIRRSPAGIRVATDLRGLTRSLLDEYRLLADGRELDWDSDSNPCMVWIDPLRLEQVIRNLVDNAIAYSPASAPIEVSVHAVADTVMLAIRDHGPGISRDELERVFQPFVRGAVSSHMHPHGTGLGLFIAATIVDSHDGQIWAESAQPGGSTFFVRLPRYELRHLEAA